VNENGSPSVTPEQLAALHEILARPEFQAATGRSVFQEYLDMVRTWFWSWAVRLLEWLNGLLAPTAEMIGPGVLYGLIAASLVIVGGAVVLVARLSRGGIAGDSALANVAETGRPRAADELARAREQAVGGDPRQAIHHLYLAVLLRLDEREHLVFDGALTNRELLPRLTAARELTEPFAALVTRFDRLWYGQQTCSSEEYAAFQTLADRVWQAAATVQPARATRQTPTTPDLSAASGIA
jgi:hypothetical protein